MGAGENQSKHIASAAGNDLERLRTSNFDKRKVVEEGIQENASVICNANEIDFHRDSSSFSSNSSTVQRGKQKLSTVD